MLIATSLMYSEDEWEMQKQKKAIQTWMDIGFRVISCNVPEEIALLRQFFGKMEFVELKRSGKEKTGKPFPYIYDILSCLDQNAEQEEELCGIVNSDIFIKNVTSEQISNYFTQEKNRILIMHRYDIDCEEDREGDYYFSGIDVFFFLRSAISVYEDKGFMLGRPEWDHWFVYEANKAGLHILEIKNKTAFHIKHKQRWTASDSNSMVINKSKEKDVMSFDEEYYYSTNTLLSDLSNRVLLGKQWNEKDLTVVKENGFYQDVDRMELVNWEKENGLGNMDAVGLLYHKGEKAYRVCAFHREVFADKEKKVSLGRIFENERMKGNIRKYIDFGDLDFTNKLGRVYIYPAGRAARLLLDCLDTYGVTVLGMVDRDPSLWGKECKGKKIYNLSVLDNSENYDQVLIASNLYIREIYEDLGKRVEKDKLIVL